VKKLIILLAFILPYSCYCQEVYLLQTIESQKPFNIQRCGENVSLKYKDQKWLIKLNYDQDKDELSWSYYKSIYPPYEGKSLFENESKKMVIPIKDLQKKKLTAEEVLNSPASAGKIFSTSLSHQQQWNDGVTWSFMQPYEFDGDNIPTLSFKKTK
jgi:predicted transcriptional regulator with HTH domain